MTKAARKLFLVELRRQWTNASFFIPVVFAVLSFFMLLAIARLQKIYDVAGAAVNINMGLIVPLSACLLAAGSVSSDVKDGWLRTLLIRPVTRQQYLLTKFLVLSVSLGICFVIAGILPNLITALFIATGEVRFDFGVVLWLHVLFLLQGLLVLAMLVFFSCWLPGLFNVVAVGVWYIATAMIDSYLQKVYWSDHAVMILKDFLFPNGFTDAMGVVMGGTGFPGTELAWGFATTAIVLALAFWSITRIQVDKSSE